VILSRKSITHAKHPQENTADAVARTLRDEVANLTAALNAAFAAIAFYLFINTFVIRFARQMETRIAHIIQPSPTDLRRIRQANADAQYGRGRAEAEAAQLREEVAALRAAATAAQRSLDAARLRTSTAEVAVHRAELAAARAEGQAFHIKHNYWTYHETAFQDPATDM
jgi:methionine synthase II (cobalamin-independent)